MVSITTLIVALTAVTKTIATPFSKDFAKSSPDFILNNGNEIPLLTSRQSYSENYTTTGTVNYTPSPAGSYNVSFSNASDFIVGKGWNPGNTNNQVRYNSTTTHTSGTLLLSLYGWTTSPIVEFYIVETYTSLPTTPIKGTLISDGSVYNIYVTTPIHQLPDPNPAFTQIKSVRVNQRSQGFITTENHIAAWEELGLVLGTQNFLVMATEGNDGASGFVEVNGISYVNC